MPVRRGRRRIAITLLLGLATLDACAGDGAAPGRLAAPPAAPDSQNPLKPVAVGSPVTAFRIEATDGTRLASAELVGQRAFVVVFFASWCGVCDLDLPVVHRALARAGPAVRVFGVSLDDENTWPAVSGFARREGMTYPIVQGSRFARFVQSYDPTAQVPAVAVVGRDGRLVDYLVGYSHTYPERLRAALDQALR